MVKLRLAKRKSKMRLNLKRAKAAAHAIKTKMVKRFIRHKRIRIVTNMERSASSKRWTL